MNRLKALDVMRGLTVALMILVNNGGGGITIVSWNTASGMGSPHAIWSFPSSSL